MGRRTTEVVDLVDDGVQHEHLGKEVVPLTDYKKPSVEVLRSDGTATDFKGFAGCETEVSFLLRFSSDGRTQVGTEGGVGGRHGETHHISRLPESHR